jgi:glycogen debranching enzyme
MEGAIQIGSQWYIPAPSPRADDRARVLKGGDTFAVFNRHGDISRIGLGEQGLYSLGTRHLSQWELTVAGRSPLLLNSTVKLDNSVLLVDQTTPDLYLGGRLWLAKGRVHLRRSLAVHDCALYERLKVASYHGEPITIEFEYRFAADFRDIFEVRGAKRSRRGVGLEPRRDTNQAMVLGYRGLDGVVRRTRLSLEGPSPELTPATARFSLELSPRTPVEIEARIACASGEAYFCRGTHSAALWELDRAARRRPCIPPWLVRRRCGPVAPCSCCCKPAWGSVSPRRPRTSASIIRVCRIS